MAKKTKKPFLDLTEASRPYPRVQKHFTPGTSKTRRSEMPSTDLKSIVRRYNLSGGIPPSQLQYGDVTGLPGSKLEGLILIEEAMEAFRELPLAVRQAIGHDPRALEAWIVSNPQLAIEHGLLKPKTPLKSSPVNLTSSADEEEGKKGSRDTAGASSSGVQPDPT